MKMGKLLDEEAMKLLKEFLSSEKAKDDIKTNNFEKLFKDWSAFVLATPHDGIVLRADLAYFLQKCGVEFLPTMHKIPAYLFWYWPEKVIHIPNSIDEIDNNFNIFKFATPGADNKIILMYEGTKEDFFKILRSRDLLESEQYAPGTIQVKCSDGDLLNRTR